ncbi:hypothetical protein SpCBS45565_g06070 [Spizellomyces sp. 'palustris']|nr:hypothetical protein SpCBS45565_g06070 [Spizellomyces sp. 'palustris']
MSNQLVPSVYTYVIDEVCEKVAPTFAEMGVGQNVLAELRQTWKRKIASMRVADFDFKESFDDGYGGYDGAGGQYGTEYYGGDHNDSSFAAAANLAALASGVGGDGTAPDSYHIPQNDGAGDETQAETSKVVETAHPSQREIDELVQRLWQERHRAEGEGAEVQGRGKGKQRIRQLDGVDDDDDEEDEDDNEDGIGSDLDDEDSEDETADVSHIILCQYEKVNRVKNKWKCTLKDGIITVNGRDYVFNKAQGDFEW